VQYVLAAAIEELGTDDVSLRSFVNPYTFSRFYPSSQQSRISEEYSKNMNLTSREGGESFFLVFSAALQHHSQRNYIQVLQKEIML
jgi:hypothetical protein